MNEEKSKSYIWAIILAGLIAFGMFAPVSAAYCDASWQHELNKTYGMDLGGDTYSYSPLPDNNYGTAPALKLYQSDIDADLYIGINADVFPSGEVINSAKLYIKEHYTVNNPDGYVNQSYCVDSESYSETNITYNNVPTCYISETVLWNMSAEVTDYYTPDVTNQLEDLRNYIVTNSQNYGYLKYNMTNVVRFNLRESQEGSSTPLYICFNSSVAFFTTTFDIHSPTNTTYTTNDIWMNFTPSNDLWTEYPCYYYLDSVEHSLGNVTNGTVSGTFEEGLSGGSHDVYYKCQNTDGSYAESDTVYFSIDNPPVTEIIQVQTEYILNSSNVEMQFMVNDTEDSSMACYYAIDGTPYPNFNMLNDTITVKTVGGITDGDHTLLLNCTDSFGSSATDTMNISIEQGTFTACFYTYADYATYITNSSLFWEGRQFTPDAVRDIAIFNDTLGKVWLKQKFTTLQDKFYCANLVNGCASFDLYATGVYTMYIADNVDFDDSCVPLFGQPRYQENAGKVFFEVGGNKTENYFIDFEKDITSMSDDGFMNVFIQVMIALMLLAALGVGYVVAIKTGSGLAALVVIAGFILLIMYVASILGGIFV